LKKRLKLSHPLEAAAVYAARWLVDLLPYRACHWAAGFLAFLGFGVFRIRRRETVNRIREILGVGEPEAVRIARRSYFNIAATALEFLRLKRVRRVVERGYVVVENEEVLSAFLREGKGAVLVAMHSGNWEMSGAALALRGVPLFYVVGVQHNPYVDRLINRLRVGAGIRVISKKHVLKDVFRRLKRGGVLGIVADQHEASGGVEVTFFGKPVWASRGPAGFARRAGVPLIPYISLRKERGRHVTRFFDPIMPDPTLSRDEDVVRMTQAYMDVFERVIREHPGDWLWLHRRWR